MNSTTLLKTNNGICQVPLETKLFSKRCISISGEINEDLAIDFTNKLLELNSESDSPITVLINSMGGELNSGLLIYDSIIGSNALIRMICRGKAIVWQQYFLHVHMKDICYQTVN